MELELRCASDCRTCIAEILALVATAFGRAVAALDVDLELELDSSLGLASMTLTLLVGVCNAHKCQCQ